MSLSPGNSFSPSKKHDPQHSLTPSNSNSSISSNPSTPTSSAPPKKVYRTNQFVRDAFQIQITPYQLDAYAAEFEQKVKAANAHRRETDALRLVNRNLAAKVKSLEEQLTSINDEHVDLVKQVVMAKVSSLKMVSVWVKILTCRHCCPTSFSAQLAKEEMAEELVRYKVLYAQAMENQ